MTNHRKVIVHIATCADGYIARPDGNLEWLTSRPAPKDFYGMNAFTQSTEMTRWMQSLLFEVRATDPLTYVVIASVLALVALLACWIPARRATKVDPLIAIRHD